MILLDRVLDVTATSLSASVVIRDTTPFLEACGVPSHIGLEYMAQTCGAYAGLKALEHGEPVRVGFLMAARRYEARQPWFRKGECLVISASEIYRDKQTGAFDCRIERRNQLVATAQLSVYQPEDVPALLQGGRHVA